MKPNFQQLLDQFEGNIQFKELIGNLNLSPDENIYMIETDQGVYYIFETDYVFNFDALIKQVKERTEHFSHFVKAKLPPEQFEDTPLAMGYPSDFEQFKKYVSFGNGSFPSYVTFLIKK